MPDKPPIRKLIDERDLGMTGDIPDDITPEMLRPIPKQDDETHVSVELVNGKPWIEVKGTF